ncbi:hypothetical protein [Microvirga puerhi]|uniref:DUF1795 domain-containing protein n=1 Tax=Microvirga puerhi TaxID=2876078 RepID=A0ABS7VNL3_9HYPH|nr:hypothetical protein [Microvirga puerhi]MBZ6076720.1 hypothetical protein [Microvirga puerhi]
MKILLSAGLAAMLAATSAEAPTSVFPPRPGVEAEPVQLPYGIGDRAGLRPVRSSNGSVALTDGPKDVFELGEQTLVTLSQAPQLEGLKALPQTRRDQTLRQLGTEDPELRDVALEALGSAQSGDILRYDIVLRARTVHSDLEVVRMLSFVFLDESVVRMAATAPATEREANLPRFRRLVRSLTLRP